MLLIYSALLYLYPPGFRKTFAAEMRDVFAETLVSRRATTRLSLCLRELGGLIEGALREWMTSLAASPRWLSAVPVVGGVAASAVLFLPVYAARRGTRFGLVLHQWKKVDLASFAALAGVSVTLVITLTIAFVINTRLIAQRRQSRP